MNFTSHRPKLAIIYGPLLHYRIALFNALNERYDLTVFTTEFRGADMHLKFNVKVIRPLRIGSFQIQPGLRKQLRQGRFDACISFVDVRNLDSLAAVFLPVAPRMFCWGVWLTHSELANRVRLAAVKRCEASLFYCQPHLEEVSAHGLDPEKLYVAPNTVAVPQGISTSPPEARDSILFVGSFDARKGLERLLRLFASALPGLPREVRLVLVGDGAVRERLVTLVSDLGLADRVEMPGRVNDPDALAPYYARARVSVSLNQAGLSVLQSMGFGVPFLTLRGSVSGGETSNITDGVTGFLVADDDAEIIDSLRASVGCPVRAAAMAAAAQAHYHRYASMQNYAQGFFDMLEGTRMTRVWKGDAMARAATYHAQTPFLDEEMR